MIGSVLLVGLLLSRPPGHADRDQQAAPLLRTSDAPLHHSAAVDWRADALRPLQVKLDRNSAEGARRVIVTVDRTELAAALPPLREHGAVPEGLTSEEAEKHPAFYANALSLLLTSWAVHDLYAAKPELGATRWKVLLSRPLDDGGTATEEMFAFVMDRALYERIAWDTLAVADFPNVAAGFSYNLRFALQVSREVRGSIDDD